MKKSIIKKKYSSRDIFQLALFLVATCFQLFLLIKYNPNIVSRYIEYPIIVKIVFFIISLPFLFVPIFIISATVVHIINNVYEFFFNRKINVNKAIEKYLREGEEKILKKHKIKLHIKILNYFKHLYNNTIILDGIILLIIMAVIALISEVWLWKL
jgi:hypothetical protein